MHTLVPLSCARSCTVGLWNEVEVIAVAWRDLTIEESSFPRLRPHVKASNLRSVPTRRYLGVPTCGGVVLVCLTTALCCTLDAALGRQKTLRRMDTI